MTSDTLGAVVDTAFLPAMRARGAGLVINVSSMGGKMTIPFMGAYNSTKYALESLSDAMRYELRPFGIHVVLIEPGVINTNFTDTAMAPISQFENTAFGPAIAKADKLRAMMHATAVGPQVIARAIHKAIRRRSPSARYVAPWFGNIFLGLLAITPTFVADFAFRRVGFLTDATLNPKSQLAESAHRPVRA